MFIPLETAHNLIKEEREYLLEYFHPSEQEEIGTKLDEIILAVLNAGYNIGRTEEREGVPRNVS